MLLFDNLVKRRVNLQMPTIVQFARVRSTIYCLLNYSYVLIYYVYKVQQFVNLIYSTTSYEPADQAMRSHQQINSGSSE